MQPEPTESSQRTSNQINPSDPDNTSQHGFLANELHTTNLHTSSSKECTGDADPVQTRNPIEERSSESVESQEQLRRLSFGDSGKARPKPSFQQISEYENALSPSPPRKLHDGPGFTVIKKKGNPLNGSQLDTFPNEVLTHILSHLPAASLSAVSLVSRRFYNLVTTPHAWRVAFSRFFPGQNTTNDTKSAHVNRHGSDQESREQLRSEQRFFSRLTDLASWRSEYILRTRLLRSLEKGKPAQIAPGHGASSRSNSAANNANAVVTYGSQLFTTVNHIHAVFGTGKKSPRFVHGADETGSACISDPSIGKIDNWGLSDPQALPQFADLFPGDLPYGFGDGPAGLPNSMDVSLPFGMVYGEGFPGGQAYFRSSEEMRGRFLSQPSEIVEYPSGIPRVPGVTEATSSVWIAKSNLVPLMTDGIVGILTGSTLGVVTAYSLGADTANGRRFQKGELTAKWILSPGVPIIGLKIDDSYNVQRKASGRVWAVALNALGEVFYLTRTPAAESGIKTNGGDATQHAWNTGRTVYWQLAEPSRRTAKDDPYHEFEVPGSYSPRSSSDSMRLSKAQITAETIEIEKFLAYPPSHFRKICVGWDMRRRLEVDFAGDDGNNAGEGIFVVSCGLDEGSLAEVRRFTRMKAEQASREDYPLPKTPPMIAKTVTMASLFGEGKGAALARPASPDRSPVTSSFGASTAVAPMGKSSPESSPSLPGSPSTKALWSNTLVEEWRTSILSLKDHPNVEITTSAIDMSVYALLTVGEDPLQTVNGGPESSPFGTPSRQTNQAQIHMPGHRGRFLGIGTKTGAVVMWNMRGIQSSNPAIVNELQPLRTILTASPEVSCLAISALYVVHGGNDGLVQTWDPLASTLQPVRTLNSRFSSRARRRLVQAQASVQGVGINLYAAGAIAIDPDPTVLRGMVSLGTHLRYWSYSSSSADQYQSKKRRLRRSNERGSNGGPDRFTNTGRGALMDYIATEQEELKKEKLRRSREEARLRGRFGVGLGGLSEEEALQYAEMISAETFQIEERRLSDTDYVTDTGDTSSAQSAWSCNSTVTHDGSVRGKKSLSKKNKDDEFDQDLEEAIRLSLLDGVDSGGRSPRASGSGGYEISITYKQKKPRRSASSSPSSSQASTNRVKTGVRTSKDGVAADDLDFALQLSLAEERSRQENVLGVDHNPQDVYPTLDRPAVGKGKGRAS